MKNLNPTADKVPSLLADLKRQKPSKKRDLLIDVLTSWSTARGVVAAVEDAAGTPGSPCSQQSWAALLKLRQVFGLPDKKPVPMPTPVQTQKPIETAATVSCGPGPYHVKIVNARDPEHNVYWCGTRAYRTEDAAVKALLQKVRQEARHRKVWCVEPYARHWVTSKKEHVIDFGSHSWYGIVIGKETK